MKFAVLMTVHNRCNTTLRCLGSLFHQALPADTGFKVFMVDDGSNDGTARAVKQTFPEVEVIQGDGNLYWNQGMRLAWQRAVDAGDWDAYLWLNDDVFLFEDALARLISCSSVYSGSGSPCVVTGPCVDPESGKYSYGGKDRFGNSLFGGNQVRECSIINGNVVLITKPAFKILGMLSSEFRHAYGDFDYSRRARMNAIPVLTVPDYMGFCYGHGEGVWSDSSKSFFERWRHFHSPQGLNPKDYFVFQSKSNGSIAGFLYLINAYRRMIFGRRRSTELKGSEKYDIAVLLPSSPPYRWPFLESLSSLYEGRLLLVLSARPTLRPFSPGYDIKTSKTVRVRKNGSEVHLPVTVFIHLVEGKPDVVLSSEFGLRTIQAAIYCMLFRRRLVIWAQLSEHTERKRSLARTCLRKLLLRISWGVVVNGASGERYIRKIAPTVSNIVRVPYTTCLDSFSSYRDTSRTLDKLLTVGQYIDRKGLFEFGALLGAWLDSNSDAELTWTLVGSGPLKGKLLAHRWHDRLKVNVLGQCDYGDLPKVYQNHGLFVFPTLEDEWGVVVMEAMAAGTPVLGSIYSEAVNELIEDGVNGWKYDPLEPDINTNLSALDRIFYSENRVEIAREAVVRVRRYAPEILARRLDSFLHQ